MLPTVIILYSYNLIRVRAVPVVSYSTDSFTPPTIPSALSKPIVILLYHIMERHHTKTLPEHIVTIMNALIFGWESKNETGDLNAVSPLIKAWSRRSWDVKNT